MYGMPGAVHGEPAWVAILRAVLPPSVPLAVTVGEDPMVGTVRVASHLLSVRWVGRGGLRQVRQALAAEPRPDVIVGSVLSGSARLAASAAGAGWVDGTGAAEIVVDSLVVVRPGERRPRPTTASRWTPVVCSVAEALLCGVAATASATAEETGHSVSSTATALRTLSDLGLLESSARRGRGSGRRVVDRDRLLDDYADAARSLRPRAELRCGVLWRDPLAVIRELGERWDHAGVAWVSTGAVAAAVVAPYLTELSGGEIYVTAAGEPGLRNAAAMAGLAPLAGGRLVLRPFPTTASQRLATETHGIRLAPWPRVFADLREVGVRGEEAAEHLRETVDA